MADPLCEIWYSRNKKILPRSTQNLKSKLFWMLFWLQELFSRKKFQNYEKLSKNHCKVRSKPDVSLLSASREKLAPPLTHTSCLIVSMCVRGCRSLRSDSALLSFFLSLCYKRTSGAEVTRTSRFHRRGSVFFVVVSGGGHFQDHPILPKVHDFIYIYCN